MSDHKMQLHEQMREQFRARQLEKNAESIRTHHPEYRRHQKEVQEEVAKVNDLFENTARDNYIAKMIETMFHFQSEGHPTNLYEYTGYGGGDYDSEQVVAYEIHRKPETPQVREERLKRLAEKEAAKHPPQREDEDDDDDDDNF